jgi:hypothetical protein
MTAMDKQSLIFESAMAIRIGVHPTGGEPVQHVIHVASQVSRMTTVCEVPTKSNLGPCSWDEVLTPDDRAAQPSSWAASFLLQQTTFKQGETIQ